MKLKYAVGIDEVGRGPLAGPVGVGCVVIEQKNISKVRQIFKDMLQDRFSAFRDSKKLTANRRGVVAEKIKELQNKKLLNYAVSFSSNTVIDKEGIVFGIRSATQKSLDKLKINPKNTLIKLDGGLKAPEKYKNQKTIIKGDEKELVISLASIIAKVTRDKKMVLLSKKHTQYGFEKNKGYGALEHRKAIKKYGLSKIHRKSFCNNFK